MTADVYFTATIWISLALAASLISMRIGISVALIEIFMGIIGGNVLHLSVSIWINFLASFGSILLTFLAGAEIDPRLMRGSFLENPVLARRTRAIAFTMLTPFYFIKAGLYVALDAVIASIGTIVVLFFVKMAAKFVGVYPVSLAFRFSRRDSAYITAMMSTGLTFGTISSLFGLTHHIISQTQYTMLVTVVILSAIIPTLVGQTFFQPKTEGERRSHILAVEAEDEVEEPPVRGGRAQPAET